MSSIVDNQQTVFIMFLVHKGSKMSINLLLGPFRGKKTFVSNLKMVLVL